jgi:hypothetical protein
LQVPFLVPHQPLYRFFHECFGSAPRWAAMRESLV